MKIHENLKMRENHVKTINPGGVVTRLVIISTLHFKGVFMPNCLERPSKCEKVVLKINIIYYVKMHSFPGSLYASLRNWDVPIPVATYP